jgi:hypothetical protein
VAGAIALTPGSSRSSPSTQCASSFVTRLSGLTSVISPPGETSIVWGIVVAETVPSGSPALIPPFADFFAPFLPLGLSARFSALAPFDASEALTP